MLLSIEEIWEYYKNKYKAINIGVLYARKLKEQQIQGLIDKNINPIKDALIRLAKGKLIVKE